MQTGELEVVALRAEVALLRDWIMGEGERAQMCTYHVLHEPCPRGRCCEKRRARKVKK